MRWGVVDGYSFYRLYSNFRLRELKYIRYINCANAIIVYREFLRVYAVYLFGVVDFDKISRQTVMGLVRSSKAAEQALPIDKCVKDEHITDGVGIFTAERVIITDHSFDPARFDKPPNRNKRRVNVGKFLLIYNYDMVK